MVQNNNDKTEFLFKRYSKIVSYLGAAFICCPILLILIKDKPENYEHLVGNFGLILLGGILFGIFILLHRFLESKELPEKGTKRNLLFFYLFVLFLQLYVVTNTYFMTGWDVGLVRFRVESIINGSSLYEVGADAGYSIYPNNLLIFYVTYLIMKIATLLSFSQPYLLSIYISCFCVTFSCFLGGLLILRILNSRIMLFIYCFFSFVLLICSPWVSIPYTDTFGMLFVMLAFYCYFSISNFYLRTGGLILTALIGYMIKPTCIFTLFAVAIASFPKICNPLLLKEKMKKGIALLTFLAIGYFMTIAIPIWIQHVFSFQLNPELRMSYAHYLLIGSNMDSCGGWNDEDYWYGISINGYEQRKQEELTKTKERYQSYSSADLLAHLQNKMLFVMNDGSFAWTKEGEFFAERVEHDHFLYPISKENFTPEGKYFLLYKTVTQFFWICVLLGIPFAAFSRKVSPHIIATFFIAICGLVTFLLIFEARARYLFLYMPVFILLSMIGYHTLFERLKMQ